MATVSFTLPSVSAGPPAGIPYRISADEFFRAIEADVFPPDRRIGLWEGRLYEKMAKKIPHAVASCKIVTALFAALPDGWCFWPENPILIDDFTAPLPDAAVVRGTADDYARSGRAPRAEDVGLVVELADSTLKENLTDTLRKYAEAGLPVYWVVNLVDRRIEVFHDPRSVQGVASYSRTERFTPEQDVPLVLDGREAARIPARDLLPAEQTR